MIESIIVALISAGIPSLATVFTAAHQNRMSKRHASKQSILQMIMEDQFNWELFKKMPQNYQAIQNEYVVYHANYGNGDVTKRVTDYNKWHDAIEQRLAEQSKLTSKGGNHE